MKNFLAALCLFIACLVFYTLTLRGAKGNPTASMIKNNLDQATKSLELSPERGRFILTMALFNDKSFSLSRELADAAYPDVGYYQGKFYVFFAPGVSLLAMPLYTLGIKYNLAQVFSFFTIVLFAAFNCVLIFIIGRKILKLNPSAAILAAFTFAFASTSWSYAITLYQHQVTTFFILTSFFAAWKFKFAEKTKWRWGMLIWICFGLSIFVDYPNAFLMLPVIIYFFLNAFDMKSKTSFFVTSLIFVIIMGVHGYYNQINFGDWKRLSGSLVGYKEIKEQQLLQKKKLSKKIQTIEDKKQPVKFFSEENLPRGFYTLIFAPDKGILIFSPIFILSFLIIITRFNRFFLEEKVLLAIFIVDLFLYSSFGDPWGGWAFGPRYLIPGMAALSLFIGEFLNGKKFAYLKKIIFLLLFIVSSGISLLGALTTNAVPPQVEADFLKTKYNFLLNLEYLTRGKSGSFIFNELFATRINLVGYYLILLVALILISIMIIFVMPRFERKKL
jgi:hypothetical protein